MATIKSYTTIEQSCKLTEILPLESADMCYIQDLLAGCKYGDYQPYIGNLIPAYGQGKIRCWSLAALLNIIPGCEIRITTENKWEVISLNDVKVVLKNGDNPVNACYELILKLHELNLL